MRSICNRTMAILATILFASGLIAGCGDHEVVSADRLEEARMVAKANSEYNAALYKAANPRFTAEYSIVGRSDTTQTAECPQGDGWSSLSIMKVDGKTVDKTVLRCSTYSASVGCFREEDFVKDKTLVAEDGSCRSQVPYPLPILKR